MTMHPGGPYNLLRVVYELPLVTKPIVKTYSIRHLLANTTPNSYTGCMLWKGATNPKTGYAALCFNGHNIGLHRLIAFYTQIVHPGWRSFLMSQRYIHVCHTCDNPPCINPFHLVIATGQYNAWDSQAKGRRAVPDNQILQLEAYGQFLTDQIEKPQVLDLDQVYYSKIIQPKSTPKYPYISKSTARTRAVRTARLHSLIDS